MRIERPLPPRPRSLVPWIAAGLLAVAIHGGAVAALVMTAPSEPADDELGADAIEIGVELTSPKREQVDLPPGPESDASAASAASVKQTAEPDKVDAPVEKPDEAPEAERVVAPEKAEQPKDPDQAPAKEVTEQSAESAAAEATAAPTMENAKEAPVAAAPSPGIGASAIRVKATWQRQLVAHLNRRKRYPPGAARRDAEITVSFTIDRTGRLQRADVTKSSGDPAFDEAALAMLHRADPLPPPPPLVADDGLTFALPVVFKAKGGA